MNKQIRPLFIPGLLIVLFLGSIAWINFHSAFWYDMDMALNSYLAGLMWKEKTLFPVNWIFGNSFFIIESTNVATLFYGLTHQATLSMSLASMLWAVLIPLTFIWCFRPFLSQKGLAVGVLCILGGIIFGTSAAAYTKGLQVLYTMASYYACYLEVLLVTLGAWLRLYSGKHVHWTLWILICLLNLAVGMHSLREMLILGIPLLAFSGLLLLLDKGKSPMIRKAGLLALLVVAAEALGYLIIKRLNIPTSPNIGNVGGELSLDTLISNLINSSKNILRISGLAFIKDGLARLPLFLCALCVAAGVVWSLIAIIRKKDTSPLAMAVLFSWTSILAVFGVGVFLFRTRDIYFFIYWLLAALSIAYLVCQARQRKPQWLTVAICLIAAVNYGYNFIPDFIDHHRYSEELQENTQMLIDQGYTTLYGDDCAVFAAASKDRIVATPIRLNPDPKEEWPLLVFPYNKDVSLYDETHARHAVVCLSNYYLDKGIREEEVRPAIEKMQPLAEFLWGERDIVLFTLRFD